MHVFRGLATANAWAAGQRTLTNENAETGFLSALASAGAAPPPPPPPAPPPPAPAAASAAAAAPAAPPPARRRSSEKTCTVPLSDDTASHWAPREKAME